LEGRGGKVQKLPTLKEDEFGKRRTAGVSVGLIYQESEGYTDQNVPGGGAGGGIVGEGKESWNRIGSKSKLQGE